MTSSEKSLIYEECNKYLLKDEKLPKNVTALNEIDQDWVLNYLSSGKETIPYDLISDFDSLNISPGKDSFPIHNFYSNMKDSVISGEDYENVKKFYTLLKISNLGERNKVYNFQDTIIICEIFKQRSDLLKKIFKCNLKKCNSASRFSACIHRNKSKCCIALSTDAHFVIISETTLIGGFSCVNTRLAFDTDILVNDPDKEKVIIEINIDEKKQLKRFSSKILKMDENNQYKQAITKPLSYGCI